MRSLARAITALLVAAVSQCSCESGGDHSPPPAVETPPTDTADRRARPAEVDGGRHASPDARRAEPAPAAPSPEVQAYVAKYAEFYGLIMKEDAQMRWDVQADLAAGRQSLAAAVVLHRAAWGKDADRWFPSFERAFALACLRRAWPIEEGATPATVAALERIAAHGRTRGARVASAACLVRTRPAVARAALLETYGNCGVLRSFPYGPPILASGPYLRDVGVKVVPEVTSLERWASLLKRLRDRAATLQPADFRNAAAANLLNQKLREALQTGQGHEEFLQHSLSLSRLAYRCLAQAKEEAAAEDEGDGLFAN